MDPLKPLGSATPIATRAEEAVQSFYEKIRPHQNVLLCAITGMTLALVLTLYVQHRGQEEAELVVFEASRADHQQDREKRVAEFDKLAREHANTPETPFVLFKLASLRYENAKSDPALLRRVREDLDALMSNYPKHWVTKELAPQLLRTIQEDTEFAEKELPAKLKEMKERSAALRAEDEKKKGDQGDKSGTAEPSKDAPKDAPGAAPGGTPGATPGGTPGATPGGTPDGQVNPPVKDGGAQPPKDAGTGAGSGENPK
ncbi:MAG: hypothetical protein HYZ53_08985 [Planctomycetes bacterium]|nr:hypothetical protein [Planctomycetota bacterium]